MNQCTDNPRVQKGQLLVEMGERKLEEMLGKTVQKRSWGTWLPSPHLGAPLARWAAPPSLPNDLELLLRPWLCPCSSLSEIQWLFLSSFLPRLQTLGPEWCVLTSLALIVPMKTERIFFNYVFCFFQLLEEVEPADE